MKLKVALIQDYPHLEENDALQSGLMKCAEAARKGADIVVFPEMWNIGYHFPENESELDSWKKRALSLDSDFISRFRKYAKDLHIAIVITFLEKAGRKPLNSLAVIDRTGTIIHRYSKIHICAFGPEKYCAYGRKLSAVDLDTGRGKVRIGTMICYDREHPETARLLMLEGAEIILVPNACELEQNRKSQLISRAFENMCGIAVANFCAPEGNGHSLAYNGIAFAKNEQTGRFESRDQLLVEGGETPEIVIAEFDIDALREYRKKEVWGNAYRRPGMYKALYKQGLLQALRKLPTPF